MIRILLIGKTGLCRVLVIASLILKSADVETKENVEVEIAFTDTAAANGAMDAQLVSLATAKGWDLKIHKRQEFTPDLIPYFDIVYAIDTEVTIALDQAGYQAGIVALSKKFEIGDSFPGLQNLMAMAQNAEAVAGKILAEAIDTLRTL